MSADRGENWRCVCPLLRSIFIVVAPAKRPYVVGRSSNESQGNEQEPQFNANREISAIRPLPPT